MTYEKTNQMLWAIKPKYKTGDNVFVVSSIIGESNVHAGVISSVPLTYLVLEGQEYLKFEGYYETTVFNCDEDAKSVWSHSEDYIFDTEEEATKMAKFWPVKYTSREWMECIGDRGVEEGPGNIHDGCELQSCCGRVSDIRDFLEKIRHREGLNEIDRLKFEKMIQDCSCLPDREYGPLLHGLFDVLNLQFENDVVE